MQVQVISRTFGSQQIPLMTMRQATTQLFPMTRLLTLLDSNLGRMPILECNGKSIGQSAAINYFVAKRLDLLGASDIEAGQVMSVLASLDELNRVYAKNHAVWCGADGGATQPVF